MARHYSENPFSPNLPSLERQKAFQVLAEKHLQQNYFKVDISGGQFVISVKTAGSIELTRDPGHVMNAGDLLNLLSKAGVISNDPGACWSDFIQANRAYINEDGTFVAAYDMYSIRNRPFVVPESCGPVLPPALEKKVERVERNLGTVVIPSAKENLPDHPDNLLYKVEVIGGLVVTVVGLSVALAVRNALKSHSKKEVVIRHVPHEDEGASHTDAHAQQNPGDGNASSPTERVAQIKSGREFRNLTPAEQREIIAILGATNVQVTSAKVLDEIAESIRQADARGSNGRQALVATTTRIAQEQHAAAVAAANQRKGKGRSLFDLAVPGTLKGHIPDTAEQFARGATADILSYADRTSRPNPPPSSSPTDSKRPATDKK